MRERTDGTVPDNPDTRIGSHHVGPEQGYLDGLEPIPAVALPNESVDHGIPADVDRVRLGAVLELPHQGVHAADHPSVPCVQNRHARVPVRKVLERRIGQNERADVPPLAGVVGEFAVDVDIQGEAAI